MTLLAEVTAADEKFGRPAVPSVYAEYELFVASGRYPYIDSVVAEIVTKFDLTVEVDRSPGSLYKTGLGKKLSHEVYLASGQFRLAQMEAKEAELRAQGFLPITELDPTTSSQITLADGQTFRLRYGFGPRQDQWALLAPRKRTNGVSLDGLMDRHRAYEEAKAAGQTSMNDPHVVMYRNA